MNNPKGNKQKKTDSDKGVTKPRLEPAEHEKAESQNDISSDTILAEKDEVKNAEERLRQKKEE